MLNFNMRVKNSDAAQPRVTNVKTPMGGHFLEGGKTNFFSLFSQARGMQCGEPVRTPTNKRHGCVTIADPTGNGQVPTKATTNIFRGCLAISGRSRFQRLD